MRFDHVVYAVGGAAVVACGLAVGYFSAGARPTRSAPPPGPVEAPAPRPVGEPGRRALLIGCTKYDHLGPGWQLAGPANDVALMKAVLTEKFGFDPRAVVCLTEGTGDDLRPTRANIAREFGRLAEAARAGDQVFVLLAGHGSRQPESDPPHPLYPEPDGIDEVFLPADARKPDPPARHVRNAIIDDELGAWLKAVADKGAFVCAVFDCCHSGNLSRAAETSRDVPPAELLPPGALDAARKRAADRADGQKPAEKRPGWLPATSDLLVTVSACRANETTPEAPMPDGGLNSRPHGLLTYTLCEVLTRTVAPLTYAELIHRVQARYAGRPAGTPTPTVEGARDREVLGTKTWPGRSNVVLRKTATGYAVNAGDLHGLTAGSVLAVEGPAGTADAGKRLGFVRVTDTTAAEASVRPVEYDGVPAPAALPDLCVCRVVFTDYGVRKLRVAVADGPDRRAILDALNPLADPKTGLVTVATSAADADFVLRPAPGGLELTEVSPSRPPVPLPAAADRALPDKLAVALERVYRARNLLTVAARADAGRADSELDIEVETRVHATKDGPGVPADRTATQLRAGEFVSYRVRNASKVKVDVTLLVVGTDYEIVRFFPHRNEVAKASLDAGQVFDTPVGRIDPPFGPEDMVAIAVKSQLPQIDFGALVQPGVQRGAGDTNAFKTPLGQLLDSAVWGGGTRGVTRQAETEMGLRVLSWRTVGPAGK